jgi:uncharacterized cupin superfamily protein
MSKASVVRLNRDGPEGVGLPFWGHLENETVIEGDPTETGYNYFTDGTGQLTSGVWECTSCTTQTDSYPVDEFCIILSGTVVITDGNGHAETFKPGDAFVIPRGMACTWHMPETTRKFYVIFDAKPREP